MKTYRLVVTVDVTTNDEQDVTAVDSEIAEAIGKIDGHPEWSGVEVELVDSDYEEIL